MEEDEFARIVEELVEELEEELPTQVEFLCARFFGDPDQVARGLLDWLVGVLEKIKEESYENKKA